MTFRSMMLILELLQQPAASKAVAINAVIVNWCNSRCKNRIDNNAKLYIHCISTSAADIELNGDVIDLSGDNTLADVVDAFNTAAVGDVRANANADGTITFSSESGVNIALLDKGSGSELMQCSQQLLIFMVNSLL